MAQKNKAKEMSTTYTVGLTERNRPELITFGLPSNDVASLLNEIGKKLADIDLLSGGFYPCEINGRQVHSR